jgi:hypothetical protein
MSQAQQQFKWDKGIKPTVSFANLEAVKLYQPQTYALFHQPLKDGDKASDDQYDYKLRHSARFGWSVTRFVRTASYGSMQVQQQQQPEQTVNHQFKGYNASNVQSLVDALKILQDVRKNIESLIVSTQTQLREQT